MDIGLCMETSGHALALKLLYLKEVRCSTSVAACFLPGFICETVNSIK